MLYTIFDLIYIECNPQQAFNNGDAETIPLLFSTPTKVPVTSFLAYMEFSGTIMSFMTLSLTSMNIQSVVDSGNLMEPSTPS